MAVTYHRSTHNVFIGLGGGLMFGLGAHVGLFPWALCWGLFYLVAAWLLVIEIVVLLAKEDE